MKVAIFAGTDEVIVLAIKGRGQSVENVDGYSTWFGPDNRDHRDYTITMGHIGAGEAVQIKVDLKEDCWGNNIEDWFDDEDEE